MKKMVKAMVVVGALVWSHAVGKRIERLVQEDNDFDELSKPIIITISCSISGFITGLIARYIVKRL